MLTRLPSRVDRIFYTRSLLYEIILILHDFRINLYIPLFLAQIAGNVAVALNAAAGHLKRSNENVNEGRGATSSKGSSSLTANGAVGLEAEIKRLVEAVGLNYARDASKRPSELSGGMARRASLALQLAQRKRVVGAMLVQIWNTLEIF